MEDPVLTVEEAADRMGVSPATVRRKLASGALPGRKSGKQWLVDAKRLPVSRPRPVPARRGAVLDWKRSLGHLRSRDVREAWVPDLLGFEDLFRSPDAAVETAAARIAEQGPFDEVTYVDVPKSPFFSRPAALLTFEDRLAFHAAVLTVADRIDGLVDAAVYSARLSTDDKYLMKNGRDQWLRWRTDAVALVEAGYTWMVKTDVSAYFDSIQHRLLFSDLDRLNADPKHAEALRTMLRHWSMVDGRGIPQGPDVSRLLGNLYLVPIDEQMLRGPWKYSRFLDDFRVFGRSRAEVTAGVRVLEKECRARGLVLSAHKTEVLIGEAAIADLTDDELGEISYRMELGADGIARTQLRSILKASLSRAGSLDERRAKFSLYRLRELRDARMVGLVIGNLERLAPIAQIATQYLYPFLGKARVRRGLVEFLQDDERNTSPFLATWLLGALLDKPAYLDGQVIDYVRRVALDHNLPSYFRAVAINVMAVGRQPGDLSWVMSELRTEFDPFLVRAMVIALARVSSLSKDHVRLVTSRFPDLSATFAYLQGRKELPSLVYRSANAPVL